MDRPYFSIIVPVYNVEKYLENCVESLVNQAGMESSIEVLLVDDGSSDRSGELCDQLAASYEQVRSYHKKNGGPSEARNYGIERASGEYLMFIDSDDEIREDSCRTLKTVLDRLGPADILGFGGVEDTDGNCDFMRSNVREGIAVDGRDYLLYHYQTRSLNVEACLYVFRKGFLDTKGLRFKDGILHEDVEFTTRAILNADKVAEIEDPLYHYMVRENSISTKKNQEKNIRDLFQVLKEQDKVAEQQSPELRRWMKNAVLDSYLSMIQKERMYQLQYRKYVDKRFLRGKAATPRNHIRVALCIVSVRLYCLINDFYKKIGSAI